MQYRRDVVVSRRTMNQSGGSIEDRLQTLVLVGRKPCKCRVAIVEAWHNQRYDQRLEHGFGHRVQADACFHNMLRTILGGDNTQVHNIFTGNKINNLQLYI